MLYATLKTLHLLSIVVWVGGMFFTLYCLRPALGVLEAAARPRLMHATLSHFFKFVVVAASLALLTGLGMMGLAAQAAGQAGLRFNMPLDWHLMALLGGVMVGVFVHIRWVLFAQLERAVAQQSWPEAGVALSRIRTEVMVNLALGVLILVATQWGALA